MRCSNPPALTEDQITAALDGELAPALHDHLAACPGCAARLEQARQFEHEMKSGLWRWDCPPPQQLGDYHIGHVGPDEARAIARHLEQCPLCSAEIAELIAFLAGDEPRTAPTAAPTPAHPRPLRPAELIARLLPRGPALALRGAAGPLKAEADGVTIFIDVQPADGGVALMGQLVADEPEHWNGALVELRQAGVLCATAAVDDLGLFSAGPLLAGTTELRITPPSGRPLVLPEIELAP